MKNLLQSDRWKHFQEENGFKTVQLPDSFGIVYNLPLVGQYLYTPRWPVENQESKIKNQKLLIEKLAKESRAGWVRVEPTDDTALEGLQKAFGATQVVSAPHDVQPREILTMDIQGDEAVLLAAMKPKTRYNIRLAEKHGITVRFSRGKEDMETFIGLIYATTERKAIRPHGKEYYRNFFKAFDETQCVLALAEHEGRSLAANLLVFHEGTAYYLHGGSSDEGRHLMAPYLLQWKSICEAKRRGSRLYDFGGVNTHDPESAWAGITRFKQGFAPVAAPIRFPGTYDIVLSPSRYALYRFLQRMRKVVQFFGVA